MTASAFAADYTVANGAIGENGNKLASSRASGATINGSVNTAGVAVNAGDNFTFDGVSGYLPGWNNATFKGNIILAADSGDTSAFVWKDGSSSNATTITFSGSLSGSGTFEKNTSDNNKKQCFTFAGDVSGFSGNFKLATAEANNTGILTFGKGGAAVTGTYENGNAKSVSGTGQIDWAGQSVVFNYSSTNAATVGNSSITTKTLTFSGGSSYMVSSALTGSASAVANNTLTISSSGTTMFTGSIENFGTITVASGATADFSGATFDFESANTSSVSTSFAGDGTVTLGAGTIFSFESLSSANGLKLLGGVSDFGDVSSLDLSNIRVGGTELTRGSAAFRVVNDTLVLDFDSGIAYLNWSGGSAGVWEVGGGNWTDVNSGADASYLVGDHVTFDTPGAEITLVGNLGAGGISVSENTTFTTREGETVRLDAKNDGQLTIDDGKTLTIDEGVTVDFGARTSLESGVATKLAGTGTVKIDASAATGHGVSAHVGADFNGTLDWTGYFNWATYTLGDDATIRLSVAEGRESSLYHGTTAGTIKQDIELATNYFVDLSGASLTIEGDVDGSGKRLTISKGTSTLTLAGTATFGSFKHTSGALVIAGSTTISGDYIGSNGDTSSSLTVNAGASLNVGGSLTLRYEHNYGTNIAALMTVAGDVSVGGELWVARDGKGQIDVSNGGKLVVGTLKIGQGWDDPTKKGSIVNLNNGGTLVVGGFSSTSNLNSSTWNFNGGTFGTSSDSLMMNVVIGEGESAVALPVYVSSATTINTSKYVDGAFSDAGATITIANDLSGVSGSLKASGSGTLNLTGKTAIYGLVAEGGALNLTGEAELSELSVTGGVLTVSGSTAKTVKTLSVLDGEATISGTLTISEGVTQTGGSVAFSTALNTKKLSVSGGGAFTNSAATKLSDSLAVSDAGTRADFTGTLEVPTISVSSEAALSIASLAQRSTYEIAVNGGSLVFGEDATASLTSQFKISLDGETGEISGLNLTRAGAGTTLDARAGTLDGLTLAGTSTLVLYAEAGENPAEGESLNGDAANVTLSGGFSIANDTGIDLSNLVFEEAGQSYAIFRLSDGLDGAVVSDALNTAGAGNIGGMFSFSEDDGVIYFTADESMQFALAWDATSPNKTWSAGSLQGQEIPNLDRREVLFGRIASSVGNTAAVSVGAGATAKRLTVRAGTNQTYVVSLAPELTTSTFAVETLRVARGTLDLQTKLSAGSVVVDGGTLLANAAGALTLSGLEKTIDVNAGRLALNHADATNATKIELSGGARLEFVNGALSSLTDFALVGTSADARAEIVWLDGATDSITDKISSNETPYVDFVVEGGTVSLGVGALSEANADVRKLGAGTLFLERAGTFKNGKMRVEEGVLQLGSADQVSRIFSGELSVASGAGLYLYGGNAFGAGDGYDVVSVSLEDGATMTLRGFNADVQTLNKVQLSLGDGAKITSASGTTNTNGLKLGAGTTISVEDGAAASISVLVQLATDMDVTVGEGATLTISKGVRDEINSSVSAGIVKQGAGTLTLSGAATGAVYSGATDIREGTLKLAAATMGAGAVTVADGATFEVATTTTLAGGVTGDGSLVVSSGTATFTNDVEIGDATVASGASLRLAGAGTSFALKENGTLTLDGEFGGNGTFKGDEAGVSVVLGEGAKLYAGTAETFDFSASSLSGETAFAKTGAGRVNLGQGVSVEGFTLTLSEGELASADSQNVEELVFDGGTLIESFTGSDAAWTTNKITVGAKGGVVDDAVKLNTTLGAADLALAGDLEIGARGELFVEETLNLSSTGGVLTIGMSTGADTVEAGGSLEAKTLNVAKSVTTIRTGDTTGLDMDPNGGEMMVPVYSEIIADKITFSGATAITGAGGAIRVGDEINFESGANVNFGGTLFTIDSEYDDYHGALVAGANLSATVNVEGKNTTATVGKLVGDVEKTGAGRLVVASAQTSEVRNITVSEGTLRFDSFSVNQNVTGAVVVSGSGVLDVPALSLDSGTAGISLTDGGTFKGDLYFSGTRYVDSELRNARISGGLSFVTGGMWNSTLTVENLDVSGTLRLGTEALNFTDHTTSSVKMSGVLTLNGASPAITTGSLVIYTSTGATFKEALSWDNFSVDFGTLGSEFVIVKSGNAVEVYNDAKGEWEGENTWAVHGDKDYTLDYSGEIDSVTGHVIFGTKHVEGRDYDLVWDDSTNSLKIVAYGTKIWKGASTWTGDGSAAGWAETARGGQTEGVSFYNNDYAEFAFSGSATTNKIDVEGAVRVGGVVFKGYDSNASFTVNFGDGASIADYVDEATGAARGSSVSVLSGTVTFKGSVNAGTMYSGGLTIAAGAGVRTDHVNALGAGTGTITLGGTLAFDAGRHDLTNDVVVTGSSAVLNTGLSSVTLSGALSGTALKKTGAGSLAIAGATELDKLTIAEGGVLVAADDFDVGRIEITNTAAAAALTFEANAALTADAELVVAQGKRVTFRGASSALNFVEFTGNNATVGFENGGDFSAGGYEEEVDENGQRVSTTAIVAEYTMGEDVVGTSTIKGDLSLVGHADTDGNVAGLFVTVADKDSTLKIEGGIVDAGDAGDFVLRKLGAGTLEITGTVRSAAELQLAGGALNVGGTANLSGDVVVSADSTLSLASGGSLGSLDGDGTLLAVVGEGTTLSLKNSNTSALAVNSKLSVAGTLEVSGKEISFNGSDNVYNALRLASNAAVTVGEDVSSFRGNTVTLANGAALVVDARLSESSGVLEINESGASVTATGENSRVVFSRIAFGNNVKLDLKGEGEVRLLGSVTENAELALAGGVTLAFETDAGAQTSRLSGAGSLEKLGAGTLSVRAASTQTFTGTATATEGKILFTGSGSLGQAKLSVAEGAEIVVARENAKIGAATVVNARNGYVAASLAGGEGKLVVEGAGNSLTFTGADAISSAFTGIIGARDGGVLNYDANVSDADRQLLLENGTLAVAEGDFVADALGLSGAGNVIDVAGTLEIGGAVLGDVKGTTALTVSGAGALTLGGVGRVDGIDSELDVYTDADFAGTLTLKYLADGVFGAEVASTQHRNTFINAGTVVVSGDARAAGSGKITLAGGDATLRFTELGDAEIVTPIVGAGTIEGDSGVLSDLSEKFSGKVVAVGAGTFTVDKSGEESLSVSAVAFSAKDADSTLLIDLSGASLDDVSEVDMGAATFASGAGTIALDIGDERRLDVDTASSDFSGRLEVASGTLKLTSDGDLGTAAVTVAEDATMEVASKIFKGSVAGEGLLVKKSSGMSFIGGEVSAETSVSAGTLALSSVAAGTKIGVSNGTLEFSKKLDASGALVSRSAGDEATFDAEFTGGAGAIVRFSHDSTKASTIVDGTFAWDGAAGKLMLLGGGEGSVFNPQISAGDVVKSGSGKWTLSNTAFDATSAAGSTIKVDPNGGTLALESYRGFAGQTLSVGSEGVLEIAGFSGGTERTIRGDLSGEGTLAVSATGVTELDLVDVGWTGALQIRAGATVKSDGSDLISKTIELIAASDASTKGGSLDLALTDVTGVTELNGMKISVYGTSKDAGDLSNGSLKVSGGVLDLRGSTLRLGGVLDVAGGSRVKVKTLESVSPKSGVARLAAGAILEIGAEDVTDGNLAALSGTGEVRFVAGTTYVKNVNAAQTQEDFNRDFRGDVRIDEDATAVLGSNASFGNARSVTVYGTLRVAQNNAGTLNALSSEDRKGTLEIANASKAVRTTYAAGPFTGTIDVKVGRLVMTTATFDATPAREIRLSGGADAGLALSNAAGATTELSALSEKNVTGTGSIYLENGEFTIAKDAVFGYAPTTLAVTSGTTLALGSGATVTSGLYVEKGATLDLTRELAPISALRVAAADDPAVPAQAPRMVQGDLTVAGELLANVPAEGSSAIHATGDAFVLDTAEVTLDGDLSGNIVVVSADGSTRIATNAKFLDASGEELAAWVGDDGTSIYVSEMAPASEIVPSGMEELYATLASKPGSAVFRAIRGSGTDAEQTAKLRNFSPVSFAGILELSTGLVQLENDLLRQRLEQRRYDRAFNESAGTVKPFANAIGGTSDTSEGKNKRPNYDLSHYGAVAGFDSLVTEDFLLGASLTIDKGKAKVHNGGGRHETDAARLNFYGMAMLDEVSYFGFGAGVGVVSADTKRNNALESLTGEASGTDVSLTATLGRMFVLSSELGLHVSPYVGMDYTYSSFGSFSETGGAQSALDVDKTERNSLRGTVGATLNWLPSEAWRFSLELAYHHEFLDTDADVDAKFASGEYRGMSASSTAYFGGENSLSVGPRVEYRINAEWSVSAGYTFETDFEDTTTHSANVGVRCRF
ncbi:MAG: autotransporter-associated beta strand repeat-containing protein [Candidatus Spyradosoma sp.]